LPIIYLAEENDGKEVVIDGQQRLTSIYRFYTNGFRLSGLQSLIELNGSYFKDLDQEHQRKIKKETIRTITFTKNSDSELKFAIFERLNTGAEKLNDMELRNCIYRGNYVEKLKELSKNPKYRKIMGVSQDFEDARMSLVENVLRFAALYNATYLRYIAPMKNFMNRDAKNLQNADDKKLESISSAFFNSVDIIYSIFGDGAFRRYYLGNSDNPSGYRENNKFNASLYDAFMFCFADKDKNQVMSVLDSIKESLIDLMTTDEKFIESITKSTSSTDAVKYRCKKVSERVDEVLSDTAKQPRCFSKALKDELFSKDKTCKICGQQIADIDDAALDHIEMYWLGGKTVPENARLTHRYCNNARPRNE
jgi:hypothetical protein